MSLCFDSLMCPWVPVFGLSPSNGVSRLWWLRVIYRRQPPHIAHPQPAFQHVSARRSTFSSGKSQPTDWGCHCRWLLGDGGRAKSLSCHQLHCLCCFCSAHADPGVHPRIQTREGRRCNLQVGRFPINRGLSRPGLALRRLHCLLQLFTSTHLSSPLCQSWSVGTELLQHWDWLLLWNLMYDLHLNSSL